MTIPAINVLLSRFKVSNNSFCQPIKPPYKENSLKKVAQEMKGDDYGVSNSKTKRN